MFKVLFKFPRLYLTLKLFGRTFSLDVGWFASGTSSVWKFGPEFMVEKMVGEASPWTAYYCGLTVSAFAHEFLILAGVSDID